MSNSSFLLLWLLIFACGLGACGDDESKWTEVGQNQLSDAGRGQYARAVHARDALFGQLSTRLMAAVSEGGPAAAIEVCSTAAPELAEQVGRSEGVVIGRTSHRLRNAENAPPAWARSFVDARADTTVFASHPDGRLGVLLPIRLQQACLGCHGPRAKIAEAVSEQIATLYPDDRATGFAAGDLRGWFWVEVPRP